MKADACFSATYGAARRGFADACVAAGAVVESLPHTGTGPDGEALAIDVAWIGPPDAERVLVVCSGTHGVEGFCGSAGQIAWLAGGLHREIPSGVAWLAVHAVNPYGFAWLRRVNEDNVDLNRNFIDHDAGHPENPGYDALAAALCPKSFDADAQAETGKRLAAYEAEHGLEAWLNAVVKGQYRHADGLFYGGRTAAWSNRSLRALLRRRLRQARHVAYVDVHSGLGPSGYGEPMSCHPFGSPAHRRLRDWYGDAVTATGDGTMNFVDNDGDSSNAVLEAAPQAEVAAICLEFGTLPEWEVLTALRRENWLHFHGDRESRLGRNITAEIREAFYQETAAWKDSIVERCIEIQRKAAAGLAGI